MKFKNKEELSKAYDELEKKFTKKCQELEKLKGQLKLVEGKEIWQPKEDEQYWTITDNGEVWNTHNDTTNDREVISYGNYFKTKEEAEKQTEYNRVMNKFRKYVEAYSEPIDKNNYSQHKWYVWCDRGKLRIDYINVVNAFQVYASSEEVLKNAIIYSAGSEEEFIRIVFGGNE